MLFWTKGNAPILFVQIMAMVLWFVNIAKQSSEYSGSMQILDFSFSSIETHDVLKITEDPYTNPEP